MTTALHAAVVVPANGIVRICAWCVPPIRLAELHAQYRCTDGICSRCLELIDREVA